MGQTGSPKTGLFNCQLNLYAIRNQRCYGRDSTVIHPPVDIERFKVADKKRVGFITVGRQTPYKRNDLAIKACTKLGLKLIVLGNGPDHKKLQSIAGPTITFKTAFNDQELASYMESSEAFIFPVLEDFGIVAVEALAAGTPVIAYQAGGALDYVIDSKTGIFFPEQTSASLIKVLKKFNLYKFNNALIRAKCQAF